MLLALAAERQYVGQTNLMATLQELADTLPNGFHDAEVSSCAIDFVARIVTFELSIWMGDESDPERYRPDHLEITGLVFCAFRCTRSALPLRRWQAFDGRPLRC